MSSIPKIVLDLADESPMPPAGMSGDRTVIDRAPRRFADNDVETRRVSMDTLLVGYQDVDSEEIGLDPAWLDRAPWNGPVKEIDAPQASADPAPIAAVPAPAPAPRRAATIKRNALGSRTARGWEAPLPHAETPRGTPVPELATAEVSEIDSAIEAAFASSMLPGGSTEPFHRVDLEPEEPILLVPASPSAAELEGSAPSSPSTTTEPMLAPPSLESLREFEALFSAPANPQVDSGFTVPPRSMLVADTLPPSLHTLPPLPAFDAPPAPMHLDALPAPMHFDAPPAPMHFDAPPAPIQYDAAPAPMHFDAAPAPMQYDAPPAPMQFDAPPPPMMPMGSMPGQALYPQSPELAPAAAPARRGRVIVVFGCRGGAGATTLATNLAGELARRGDETLLIDLDLQLGDTMVALDINHDESASFANLAREYAVCEDQVLKRRMARHRSGLYVLAQNGKLEELDSQLVAMVPKFFDHLRSRFDAIVIDGVRDFDEIALAALDSADVVALVATQDVAAIRRARRVIEVLDKLEVAPSKRQLIVNRHKSFSKISAKEIERALGMAVTLSVKNDYDTALRAQNRGALVREVSKFKRLARDLGRLTTLAGGARP